MGVRHRCVTNCGCNQCACGAMCGASYCGRAMHWVANHGGAAGGAPNASVCVCTDMNGVAINITDAGGGSVDAATWNATRPAWSTIDAKAGTKVCSWVDSETVVGTCDVGGTELNGAQITTFQDTDGLWRMLYAVTYTGPTANAGATMAGESLFPGGGAAGGCGTPGEATPTFQLDISLSAYEQGASYGQDCTGPTTVHIDGNPQA